MSTNAPHAGQAPHAPNSLRAAADELAALRPLLAAEAAAEAVPGGVDAADLEQSVLVRLLELPCMPPDPAAWLRAAVRSEARRAARRVRRETCYALGGALADGPTATAPSTEQQVLAAEEHRALRAAVRGLPGRCPELVAALLSRSDPTYREISHELGISQGSLGPMRSRCLGCLRVILTSRIAAPV
jgi:RNA polymerase sigma factor (sigma-70 family)